MTYPDHSREMPKGWHAIFGASNYHWVNDETEEDVLKRIYSAFAADIGTCVHEVAAKYIRNNMRLTKSEARKVLTVELLEYKTSDAKGPIPIGAFDANALAVNFVNYVNDAIGYMMKPELGLYYSRSNGGTADALIFDEKRKLLRIHDLKTGVNPCKFTQLEIYAAYFCLENYIQPQDISFELRIYQNGEVNIETPSPEIISKIIETTKWHSDIYSRLREG